MQMVLNIPDTLADKFNQAVPSSQQSHFLTDLLEKALGEGVDPFGNDPVYLAALAVEQDTALNAEMKEWHDAFIADGIGCHVDMSEGIDATR